MGPLASAAEGPSTESLSVGVLLGHAWLARQQGDEETPVADHAGLWFTLPANRFLHLGAEASTSINPFGCDEHRPCYDYELVRIGALVEAWFVITENHEQGLEAWSSLGPQAVLITRRTPSATPENTAWGVGLTGRLGPRVRMQGLTLAPYFEGLVASVDGSIGYGVGLQVGLRL